MTTGRNYHAGRGISDESRGLGNSVEVIHLIKNTNEKTLSLSLGLAFVRLPVDELLCQGEHLLDPAVAREGAVPEALDMADTPHV